MSAAHLEVLPTLALQLAARVEAYRVALRSVAADPRNPAQLAAVRQAVTEIGRLALPLPAVWSDWGRFVVAHADLTVRWVRDPGAPQFELQLMAAVEGCAEALMRSAVHWAIFEEHPFPVAAEVAQAFVDWEAARRVVFDMRRAAAGASVGSADARATAALPPGTREAQAAWELQCAGLLGRAVALLEGTNQPGA